jgi:hypothetical protein
MKFKNGDKVIVGKFPDKERGVNWNVHMEDYIGKIGTIKNSISNQHCDAWAVIFENTKCWWYPETALISLREEKLKRILDV